MACLAAMCPLSETKTPKIIQRSLSVCVVSIWPAHFCENCPLSSTNVPGYLYHPNINLINYYHRKPITLAILEKDSTKVEA